MNKRKMRKKLDKDAAISAAVSYLLGNPTASAYRVSKETGVSLYTAQKLINQRQTSIDVLTQRAEKLIAEYRQVDEALTDSKGTTMLKDAAETFKQRGQQYGSCRDTLVNIAQTWTGITGYNITPDMAGRMMIGLKLARLKENPTHKDSIVDIAGWAAVYAEGVQ